MTFKHNLRAAGTALLPAMLFITQPQAGQQQAPAPVIHLQVRQVLVPVIVTDRHGHYVTDLGRTDFTVLEDGIPQTVVDFRTSQEDAAGLFAAEAGVARRQPKQSAAQAQPPVQLLHLYAIALDTLNSSFQDFVDVRTALRKLFRQEGGTGTEYLLVALGRQTTVLQGATGDAGALLEALGSKQLQQTIQQRETSNLAMQQLHLSNLLGDYCRRCPCTGGTPEPMCQGRLGQIEMWASSAAEERTMLERQLLAQLGALTARLATFPGKRTLVFISDGFNMRPGRELFGMMAAELENPAELQNNPGDPLNAWVESLLQRANANDVSIYTLDSRGLFTSPAAPYGASNDARVTRQTMATLPMQTQEVELESQQNADVLAQLAGESGGLFYRNSNDLLKGLKQALADGRQYYVLAYVPSNRKADGNFRTISVQVDRRNLRVRTKKGYWALAQ